MSLSSSISGGGFGSGGGGGGGGTGDVVGPADSIDNAAARYDGTTGKLIQGSAIVIGDVAAGVLPLSAEDGVTTNIGISIAPKGSGTVSVSSSLAISPALGVLGIGGLTSAFAGLWTRSGSTDQMVIGKADRSAPTTLWVERVYFSSGVPSGYKIQIDPTSLKIANNVPVVFSSTSVPDGTPDAAIQRGIDASVLALTNASTGGGALELTEMTAPPAPATNKSRLFAEDNGSGKTRLVVRFPSGAAQVIATEP